MRKSKNNLFYHFIFIGSLLSILVVFSNQEVANATAVSAEVILPAEIKKQKSLLQQVKIFENQEKWSQCAEVASQVFRQDSSIRGWVLTTWLRCARKAEYNSKQIVLMKKALGSFDLNTNLRVSGPWLEALQVEAQKARLQLVESLSFKNSAVLQIEDFTKLLELIRDDNKSDKAKALGFYGDWARTNRDFESAKTFYEQSLDKRENQEIREKYQQVLLTLNKKSDLVTSVVQFEPYVSDAEKKFDDRFENSLKNNDHLALVEDCVSYLNRFPTGRKAQWTNDKILETYFYFFDQMIQSEFNTDNYNKWSALRDRTLSAMEKSEWSRLSDWSRQLHRRHDFLGSLRLAEKSLSSVGASSYSDNLLYVAGRSAQFLGEEKKAQKYFEQYSEQHSAGSDISEVLFRLGLIHMRREQFASAIAIFERLLSLKENDRYELSARYWMIRGLQRMQSPRTQAEIDKLLQKFPFTYYGLKLRAEANQNQMEWPYPLESSENLKGALKLTGPQKKAWDRLRVLAVSGWRNEAAIEAKELPMPLDAKIKVLLAQSLAEADNFAIAIRLLNQVSENSIEFRTRDIVSFGFPKDQEALVKSEAKKYSIHPILVWSLIRQESAFDPKALSRSQAAGYMQLIPSTAKEVAQDLKIVLEEIPDDVYSPERNIPMGTKYLSQVIRQFQGAVPVALASYNAGPKKIKIFLQSRPQYEESILAPPQKSEDELWMDELPWYETSFYVKAILRNVLMYRMLDERRVAFSNGFWQQLVLSPKSNEISSNSKQNN